MALNPNRKRKTAPWALLPLLLASLLLPSCEPSQDQRHEAQTVEGYIRDFRTIPGVTETEINAILALQAKGQYLTFGTQMSAEAYEDSQGRKAGFLVNFAGFLQDMLGIEVRHSFYERGILREAMDAGWLDFACEMDWLTGRDGRPHFITDPIYDRVVKVFKSRATGDLMTIAKKRPPRFGFLEMATIRERVLDATRFRVEVVTLGGYQEAAAKLLSGEIDAFFEESGAHTFFDAVEGIASEDYFPPIDLPLSLGTYNPEYEPIISVIQKFLEAGGFEYIASLYSRSALLNQRFLFDISLDEEEKFWLKQRVEAGKPVLVAAESDDYPVSFYNQQLGEFQGIAHDILDEISQITGLEFVIANEPWVAAEQLESMVYYGEADVLANYDFMTDLGGFLLVPRPHSYDRYALLTNVESKEIQFNQIFYGTAGLVRDDHRSHLYRKWFPNNRNIIYYRSIELALQALKRNDVLYVMGSTNLLLSLTNYREDPGFKAGLVFEYQVPFGFAISQEEVELRDILDKAMALASVYQTNQRWNSRMFDYSRKFFRDVIPILMVFVVLLVIVLLRLIYENRKNSRLNRDLESLVDVRTKKLLATQVDLERERLLLQRILESCPICFTITIEGRISFLTPFAETFLQMKKGDNLRDCFVVKEELEDALKAIDAGQTVNWRPMKVSRGDGVTREVLVNSFSSDYYGRPGTMTWFTDVTELRENARDLALARDIAEDSAKAKSEFLANMSHEIRTPMNAIVGLTQLSLQTELTDTQRDYLDMIQAAAKSLLGIINDILDFSKIEAGKLSMERIPFQLEDVVDATINLSTVRANEKGLELILEIAPTVPTSLVGDPTRLGQILNNLMSNAIKFTEKGRVTMKVSVIEEDKQQTILRFSIQDTGIGLTEEQISKLFTAFNQADTSVTRRFGGTGLGLAISKRLVGMMGGDIWCEGKPGEGSTFTFTGIFGIHDSKRHYASVQEDLKDLTALAVDDYEPALLVMAQALETLGLKVFSAQSGPEALGILKMKAESGKHVDIAILDWKMPAMDGIETAIRIKDMVPPEKLPIIIIATAHDRQEVSSLAEKAGVKAILAKPVMISNLLNILNDTLSAVPKRLKKGKRTQVMDASSVSHLKGSHILLAEDNEVNQLVAKRLLKNAGFEVDIANNGKEAFDKVIGHKYDLVLMDIQMPEMDGLTSTKAIRALPGFEDLPIVAMTAHAMSGDREMSLSAGMNAHITKPINLNDLFQALNRWIRKEGADDDQPEA
jgi:signal transduction histidine kinase/CheY-like chemotaxis protein